MNTTKKEVSAGGLALKKDKKIGWKILMIQVRNRQEQIRWTFPKGHLEPKETAQAAALREVREETGWVCKITPMGDKTIFKKVQYYFLKGRKKIDKRVIWYVMRPLRKAGRADPQEVLQSGWFSLPAAERKITYPSDLQLLTQLKKYFF